MVRISYLQMALLVSLVWLAVRLLSWRGSGFSLKREARLLPVYICILVVVRFTFCPFGRVDGKLLPLLFDHQRILPLKVNLIPFVYWFDYPTLGEALLNLIGNTAMFIPLGIVWPGAFPKLNTHGKAIAAGVGVSLCIELLQLPFFDRTTDIDDLILNTLGYLIGYGIYRLIKALKGRNP